MKRIISIYLSICICNTVMAQFVKNPSPATQQQVQVSKPAPKNLPTPGTVAKPSVNQVPKAALDNYQAAMKETDLNKVITKFSKAIEIKPDYFEAIFYRGIAYYQNRNPKKALSDFDKIIQTNPRNYAALTYRGRAKESLKMFTEALNDYNLALQLNPKYTEGLYYRGKYFKENGNDNQKACADLKQAKNLGFNVAETDLVNCK